MKHVIVEIRGKWEIIDHADHADGLTTVKPQNQRETNAKGDQFMDNDGETLEADGPLFFPERPVTYGKPPTLQRWYA